MSFRTELLVESELKKAEQYSKNKEYKEAFSIYIKLTENNCKDPGVWNNLGNMYLYGLGTLKNEKHAFDSYRFAAGQGDSDAQCKLGMMYLNGRGTKKNEEKALHFFHLAAKQSNSIAQFSLGWMYGEGQGTEKNEEKALHFYQLAAEQGNSVAQYNLGLMHENGRGTPKNEKRAFHFYHLAAEGGDVDAQCKVGLMCLEGQGTEKDEKEALRFYRLAAEQGDSNAQYNVGWMHKKGRGTEKDDKQAFQFYQLAADQKNPYAQSGLGAMYEAGQGIKKDEEKAVYFYRLAAKQGHYNAKYNLALMCEAGRGTKKDLKEAAELYHSAAESGSFEAQSYLGCEYFKNKSELIKKRDPQKARYYFSQLAEKFKTIHGTFSLADLIPTDCDNAWLPRYFPFPVYQQGLSCGLYALSFSMRYAVSESDFNYYARKEGDEKITSLRFIAKKLKYSSFGEMYDIRGFDDLAKYFNVPGKMIHVGDIKKEEYIGTLCHHLREGFNLVVACDVNNEDFPESSGGLDAHWMHLFGYYYNKDECYFLATQHGEYYAINGDKLFESNKQLPEKIPLQGYYKVKLPGGEKVEKMIPADQDMPEGVVPRYSPITRFEQFKFGIFGIRAKNDSDIPRTDVIPLSSLPSGEKLEKWVKK